MPKRFFNETDRSRAIAEIQFGPLCDVDIERCGLLRVTEKSLYNEANGQVATKGGPLDNRMGTGTKSKECATCKMTFEKCVGHYGYVDYERPVFHVGFFKATIKILQMICKNCSMVLLKQDDKDKFHDVLAKETISYLQKKALLKRIHGLAKKTSSCPQCGDYNGTVKKFAFMKIVHVKYKETRQNSQMVAEFRHSFENTRSHCRDLDKLIESGNIVLNPIAVYHLFNEIRQSDVCLLMMNDRINHPRDLLVTRILAPPLCIRPSVTSDTKAGSNEDDLTIKISEIVYLNNLMRQNMVSGSKLTQNLEAWEFLQLQTALFINSELPRIPLSMTPKKWTRGFAQRLKGKQGRFRGNLSGKRVDFSGRTVISPDPNLNIDQVAIPMLIATTLTYPVKVTDWNIHEMRILVNNGPDKYPGANFLTTGKKPVQRFLKYGNKSQFARDLKKGDIVERHLQDGDYVLFNRQPSLHKLSIMCLKAKISPHKTFSFNECVCTPFNADFDGDEMNIHVPQTEEARCEAMLLMDTKANLVSPRNGELIIGATQDFLTGSYLITQRDQFFDRAKISQLFATLYTNGDENMAVDLPPPAIWKPCRLWTGKQLFSMLLRPSKSCPVLANLRAKTKFYSGNEDMSPDDSFVVIRNSELVCGCLDKSILGSGGKNNIFYILLRDYGSDIAAKAMWRVARLSSWFLMNRGFSIGIGDVKPHSHLSKVKQTIVEEGYDHCNRHIEDFRDGKLISQPGCTLEETLESMLNGKLSDIRESAGSACFSNLPRSNAPLIMALSGSKGSKINISQMIACVGQQTISGGRIPDGFEHRSLPHFEKHSKLPAAKGFVENSFFTGLTPTEFFFHTMAGREGLVDTAVKTAETGYMQRRLVKCLEDLCCEYDTTVRTSIGEIVQFVYGTDGLDPSTMEAKDKPYSLQRLLDDNMAKFSQVDEEYIRSHDLMNIVKQILDDPLFAIIKPDAKQDIVNFCEAYAVKLSDIEKRHNLFSGMENPVCYGLGCVTKTQLNGFLQTCRKKYLRSLMEPGTAVGALCAQSIGEPCTQMTLKTFHFAGVASMNITLGVPRIKELVNGLKNISTPIITARLVDPYSVTNARIVKGRLEKTFLGEIARGIEEVYLPDDCFLIIRLDTDRIRLLRLEISVETVVQAIVKNSKLKIKYSQLSVVEDSMILLHVGDNQKANLYYVLQRYKELLTNVVVKGLPTVSRAIISLEDDDKTHKLFVEGSGFQQVISTVGVDGVTTTSNNIIETFEVLGIEAARQTIINEVMYTMKSHGIEVDSRHVMLLADLMTYKGEVLGLTRAGLAKMKESVLMLASFEQTIEHLYDAAYYGQKDIVSGVSERIIMGLPMRLGTGIFKLLYRPPNFPKNLPRRHSLLDMVEQS